MTESDEFQEKTYIQVLGTVYPFLVKEDIQVSAGSVVTVKLLSAVVDFMSGLDTNSIFFCFLFVKNH